MLPNIIPMASLDLHQNLCRICLVEQFNMMDWNNDVHGFCGITYKDCYYKYTQLEQLVLDPFSAMLCEICSKDLQNAHLLIEKAIQSHKTLNEQLFGVPQRCDDENIDNMIVNPLLIMKPEPKDFELLNTEQSTDPVKEDDQIGIECTEMSCKERTKDTIKVKRKLRGCKVVQTRSKIMASQFGSEDESDNSRTVSTSHDLLSEDGITEAIQFKNNESCESDEKEISSNLKSPHNRRRKQHSKKINTTHTEVSKIKNNDDTSNSPDIGICITSSEDVDKSASKKKIGMCSYCSKTIAGIASLKAHEETHKEHRERAVTCPVCDLKLFAKKNLYSHMKVHVENREKIYKCDFCEKSFFNRGSLNVHRRLHLGQMIPCPLCSKQFFRQIDLDKHMNSHSATPINADIKKRSRYFVYCKDCNKSMLSSSWKAHEAVHKNEPLMKCSICTKDFFCRKACVTHMKKVHKTTREEYDKFIIYYTTSRLSRLMLEQQKKLQPIP